MCVPGVRRRAQIPRRLRDGLTLREANKYQPDIYGNSPRSRLARARLYMRFFPPQCRRAGRARVDERPRKVVAGASPFLHFHSDNAAIQFVCARHAPRFINRLGRGNSCFLGSHFNRFMLSVTHDDKSAAFVFFLYLLLLLFVCIYTLMLNNTLSRVFLHCTTGFQLRAVIVIYTHAVQEWSRN